MAAVFEQPRQFRILPLERREYSQAVGEGNCKVLPQQVVRCGSLTVLRWFKQFRKPFYREHGESKNARKSPDYSHPRFELGEILRPARPDREVEVRKAVDRRSDRPVVLKRLLPGAAPKQVAHFQNECELTPSTNIQFVVRQLNIDAETPRALFATEFVTGLSLQQSLKSGLQLTFEEKLTILDSLCQALAAIHSTGIVHGDIAPSNIIIREDKSVCLIDFGLAQRISRQDSDHETTAPKLASCQPKQPTRNAATHISGTPGFLSPEAIHLKPLQFESDIYSWGCIAFYLLSEAMPFEGRTPIEVVWKQKNQPPPTLDLLAKNLGFRAKQVQSLVLQCMQTRTEDRPSDVNPLRECISTALGRH